MPLTKRNAVKKKLEKTNTPNRTKKKLSARAAPKQSVLKRRRVRSRIAKGK